MRVPALTIALAGLALLGTCRPTAAQQYMPQYGNMNRSYGAPSTLSNGAPVLNPYLNLVRGNNPALGLFLGTYPEIDRRNFQSAVTSALPALENYTLPAQQAAPDILTIPTLTQTGHLSAFQSYGSYYNYGNTQRPYFPLNPNQARSAPR